MRTRQMEAKERTRRVELELQLQWSSRSKKRNVDDDTNGNGDNTINSSGQQLKRVAVPVPVPAPRLAIQHVIRIFIRDFINREREVHVNPAVTVRRLTEVVAATWALPAAKLRFTFAGERLDNYRTLRHYKITQNSTIDMLLDMAGTGEFFSGSQ
jgi:hypothetical protein